MYSVYQPWDPLRVCVVGRSYPPEFYSWMPCSRLRNLFEKIALETEEDFQNIIRTLEKFGVRVIRPNVPTIDVDLHLTSKKRIPGPISMNPRDQMIMVGKNFYLFPYDNIAIKVSGRHIPPARWNKKVYEQIRGKDWPTEFMEIDCLPLWVQKEIETIHTEVLAMPSGEDHAEISSKASMFDWWKPLIQEIAKSGNNIITNFEDCLLNNIAPNGITHIGKDLYFGAGDIGNLETQALAGKYFSDYRCHWVTTGGHIDGCFTPVKPGLIVSICDIDTYADTFPGWEVVYLEGESWSKVQPFLDLKKKNQGRWWIKGHEYDDELIDYVETWLNDWTGYVEESVFDVNILAIDQKNIIVNGYNEKAFRAFEKHGITPHICPLRHRYFWDGGVHCVTLDLDRQGDRQDFFPERGTLRS